MTSPTNTVPAEYPSRPQADSPVRVPKSRPSRLRAGTPYRTHGRRGAARAGGLRCRCADHHDRQLLALGAEYDRLQAIEDAA
jgi:hypothetical protein